MRRMSDKRKEKEQRGKGTDAEYTSYIDAREINSNGTTLTTKDWKTGRSVQLLSQVEAKTWFILRWNDRVKDINEQVPLDRRITIEIAEKLSIRHPAVRGENVTMTTDFLVTFVDGTQAAIYVKYSRKDLKKKRTREKMEIEKHYWQEIRKVPFYTVTLEDINEKLAINIEMVTRYYSRDDVFDRFSLLKHLIATKQIKPDMENELLDYQKLLKEYGGLINDYR